MPKRVDVVQAELVATLRGLGGDCLDPRGNGFLQQDQYLGVERPCIPSGKFDQAISQFDRQTDGDLLIGVHLVPLSICLYYTTKLPLVQVDKMAQCRYNKGIMAAWGETMIKVCKACGKQFKVKPSAYAEAVYCSRQCHVNDKRVEKTCQQCGATYFIPRSHATRSKYCSGKCFDTAHSSTRIELTCGHCSKGYLASPSRQGKQRYCSPECRKAHVAATSPINRFVCQHCGREFSTYEPHQNFCTMACKVAHGEREKKCPVCGKVFRVKPSHYHTTIYCSSNCMAADYKQRLRGEANPNFRDMGKRVCQYCGRTYHSYNKNRKYCSTSCATRGNANWKYRLPAIRLPRSKKAPTQGRRNRCHTCGVEFFDKNKQAFCPTCRRDYHARGIRICVICGRKFHSSVIRKACSPQCRRRLRGLVQQGPLSHRWQGGKVEAARTFRNSLDYTIWREQVFKRDNYTCQMCHKSGGKLAAHHIRPFANVPELRLAVSNGITLCWPCHRQIRSKEWFYEKTFQRIVKRNEQKAC